MTININAANITSIRLAEQSSAPSTPASGFASLFVDTNGDLATRKDAGGIKIATSPATGDYIFTIDGTGTAARLNASNVFTSAQVLPAGTVGAPALTTTGDTNTGIYFPGADRIGFATNGVIRGSWTTDGLCFNADTAAANALDDYEEGTWTPEFVSGTGTWTSRTATYTKIGRFVMLHFDVTVNLIGTSPANRLIGIPFTHSGSSASGGNVHYLGSGAVSPVYISIYGNTSSEFRFNGLTAAGGTFADLNVMGNGTRIIGSFYYYS